MNQELIEKLMQDLESEWSDNVRSAAHALASLGQPALGPLLKAFEQENEALRCHAAIVLKQMQPHDIIPILLELLESERTLPHSKLLLVDVLIHLLEEGCTDSSILSTLLHLSREPQEDLRLLVAQALGRCDPSRGVPLLRQMLPHSSHAVVEEIQHQLSLHPVYTEDEIPLWDTTSYEAAARLRVRNGLSESRRDAIETMLERGDDATAELLPLLQDAGEQTLEEMSPILRTLGSGMVFQPITDIIDDQENPPSRRLAALQAIRLVQSGSQELKPVFTRLLTEESPDLRLRALEGLLGIPEYKEASEERGKLWGNLGSLLCHESDDIRYRAAALLADEVMPFDQTVLRFLLDALHRFPSDRGRVYLMRALARLMEGFPSIQFLLPELLDFVGASRGESLTVGLTILDKFVPVKPSPLISDVLLCLIPECDVADTVSALLSLLERVLPRNYTSATEVICSLEKRFPGQPLWEPALRLCGRICDHHSIDTLIRWAQRESSPYEHLERFRIVANEVLASLHGTLREVWQGADGRYHHRPAAVCHCGGRLIWQSQNGREELRCRECDAEYLPGHGGVFQALADITTPLCACPTCRRKNMLAQMPDGTLICPASGELYSPRFDTKDLLRVNGLEHGVCKCCHPPQPLEANNDRILCIQTKRSPEEVDASDALPVIETLDLPSFQLPVRHNPTQQPTPTSAPSMRVLQLRKNIMPELAVEDEE